MGTSFLLFQTMLFSLCGLGSYIRFLGPQQLGDPCPSFLRTTVMRGHTGRGGGCSETQSQKLGNVLEPQVHSSLAQAPPEHPFCLDSWARSTKSPAGSQCGRLGSGSAAWLCPDPRAPDPQSWWPRGPQPGVSSRAWRPHTLPVGIGKPLWLSWPFSSFSSFGSPATLGPH